MLKGKSRRVRRFVVGERRDRERKLGVVGIGVIIEKFFRMLLDCLIWSFY